MKKIISILILFVGISQFAKAQCTTNASGFTNNTSIPMYNVQGMVQVVLNANNTVTVNLLSSFSTAAGPDVRIFLVDRGTLTDAQLKISSNFLTRPRIAMGLSPASGMATFTQAIPAGITISDFETVYFYCQAFNQFWDFGSYTPFTPQNCVALSTTEFEDNKLTFYPNPTTNVLNIKFDNNVNNFDIAFYNALGSLVSEIKNYSNSGNAINISQLNSGLYFVKITDSEQKVYLKRFIKH